MHLIRRRARDDERGAVAILVAASLVVLCMGCAMAVDLGNVEQLHRHAQYTVEDAAISGADLLEQGNDTLTQVVTATEGYIDENWANMSASAWNTCPNTPSGFTAPTGLGENCITFNGTATAISVEFPPQPVPFSVARMSGVTSGVVQAQATAVLVPGIGPCALCLLGPSGQTLLLNGSGGMTVSDGPSSGNAGIVVDSSDPTAAAQIKGASGIIQAPSIGVVGSYQGSGFVPTPTTGVTPLPDPLGGLPAPTPASTAIPTASYTCSTTCGTLPANTYGNIAMTGGTLTIPPGNYSSIKLTGNPTLTLESGNYFFTGPFTVSGTAGASVQQAGGVLLYFTCSDSTGTTIVACTSPGQTGGSLSLGGTGDMTLAPQTTGTYAGLTVFYDRNNDSGITLAGTSGLDFSGTVYAKDSQASLGGTGEELGSMIIVNSATVNGTGTVKINYDASENIAPPGAPYLCSTAANNC